MKIVGFRITNYRSINDSGWIELEDLTVLVGKNESGKTSLLRALHKFNPFKPDAYEMDREWPRGRRQERDPNAVVCAVRFQLDEAERSELSNLVGPQFAKGPFVVQRSYEGGFSVELPTDKFPDRPPQRKIDELYLAFATLGSPAPGAVWDNINSCTEEIRSLVNEGRYDELLKSEDRLRTLLLPTSAVPAASDTEFVNSFLVKAKKLATVLKSEPSIRNHIAKFVTARIPTFIYMDDYRSFRGSARIDQVHQRKQQNVLTNEDGTLITIMTLAGLDLDKEFQKGGADNPGAKEQRQYDLSDAGRSLTREIAQRWKQRKYEIEFRADAYFFFTMVRDQAGPYLVPLEDRSKGFQWFFSFDLMFMFESRGAFKGCVLLLDEPGLHLHPDAQRDLLERLEAYAKENTLIYTTHLPFMIDLRKPDRIRTLSETPNGVVVDKDLNLSQPEAKFTLQAALGMSAAQSHLIAQRNLVVEGVDDFWTITELSNLMARSGCPALPEDILITAAGGASEGAYMATFMIGQNLEVVVLFDSDRAGEDAADKLIKNWLARYKAGATRVLKIGDVLELGDDAATEDVFDDAYYLAKAYEVYSHQLRAAGIEAIAPTGTGQVVKRVERFLSAHEIKFNKGSVAKVIRADLRKMATLASLSQQTQERATKLITLLAEAFKPVAG